MQWPCDDSRASQRLSLSTLSGTTPDTRLLRFEHSDLCLLVENQGTANGTAIVQGTCPSSNDYTQGFNLVE